MAGLNRTVFCRAAIALLTVIVPVAAANAADANACRNYGAYNAGCRNGTNPVGAYRPYEHWQDGSAAVGSTAPPPQQYSPTYFGGHNALYGFGR